jgi:hypothetical protein
MELQDTLSTLRVQCYNSEMGFDSKIAEHIEIGFDSKESFTKMNKNCSMGDGIWVEMMELEAVEIK